MEQSVISKDMLSKPDRAESWYDAGSFLWQMRKTGLAALFWKRSAIIFPWRVDVFIRLGNCLAANGLTGKAIDCLRSAIIMNPDFSYSYNNIAVSMQNLGRSDQAILSWFRATLLDPFFVEAHANLGNAFCEKNLLTEGLWHCQRAIEIAPDNADAYDGMGNLLNKQNRKDTAQDYYLAAIILAPDQAISYSNSGTIMQAWKRLAVAEIACRRAVVLRQDISSVWFNLGSVLQDSGQREAALQIFRTILCIEPVYAEVWHNLAMLGEQTLLCYRRAIACRPSFADAWHNLALTLLAKGEFKEGWRAYEWRWDAPQFAHAKRDFLRPQWKGEAGAGRVLLIHAEQGFGDILQFCRYAPMAASMGWQVIFEAPAPLTRLLSSLSGIRQVITKGDKLPDFAMHCPVMSLPFVFGTLWETIPSKLFYLEADLVEKEKWQKRLDLEYGRKPRVGIAWEPGRSSPFVNRQERFSLPTVNLAMLLVGFREISFFSLQKEWANYPKSLPLIDLMDEIKDFADTAAIIANLDLVITIDTSVAHLAGALGKPVWLLLDSDPGWRWCPDRGKNLWYPSMRLFRQGIAGDWSGVVENVRMALSECFVGDFAAEHFCEVGSRLQAENFIDKAIVQYRNAIISRPEYSYAFYNAGLALYELNQHENAIKSWHRAIILEPLFVQAHSNLGNILGEDGKAEASLIAYHNALVIKPDHVSAYSNLGAEMQSLGRLPEAEQSCRRAVVIRPDFADAQNNMAMAMLGQGKFEAGWEAFEWRWDTDQLKETRRDFAQPQWNGELGWGRKLLIHAEQGYGDNMQFCRYASMAAERGWRVFLEVPSVLVRLMKSLANIESVIGCGEKLPEFDAHCPVMSLPKAFGANLANIPAPLRYLHAEEGACVRWQRRLLADHGEELRIGLAWDREPRHQFPHLAAVDRRRSIPPDILLPLFDLKDIVFFSLQKQPLETLPPTIKLVNVMDEMDDFADTAAFVANLDLVISIDTAIIHLGAAIGKPVWLLDRYDNCWRWLHGREDSPWYPTLRIFRQTGPGDWKNVIGRVVRELEIITPSLWKRGVGGIWGGTI